MGGKGVYSFLVLSCVVLQKIWLGYRAEAKEDDCCEETKGGGGVVPGTALSADKGPTVALMEAGLTDGTATADGESDVVITGEGISTCRDMAESMYGGNSDECTVVEGAD
ncbi:hypothetical protein LWI28_024148 [Acer negundo]|uniref:Uncharacterized protein n=1 Tax=Acer negundo TaxID=4023 RepID=A0AAD5IS65_ACENE|nr:hypothetical protein LWI28_024148 [Acer negundo]